MDNNLLGITTLAQQSSKTPLVTGGKGQQLVGGNIDSFANNMSQSKIEGLSTVDYNNSKRSPFRSTNRNGLDESSDNISRAQSNYDQTTMFGSPGLNKSIDKNSKARLQQLGSGTNLNNSQQQPNNMFSTFGSQSTSMPGQSAQRQSQQHLNYASPDKVNARSARKGSNAKSARSNSSREQSTDRHGSAARRGSTRMQHSASRGRSYSGTDQDSQERSFTYPCQAFKQFLLAVREGKIDMKDLNNSPFLIDYLTMQAQIGGGGSGGAGGGDKAFANSLRSSTASNRSGSKSKRDNSKSNKKQRRASNLGDTLKAPRDSIIEEEEDDNMPMSTKNNKPRQHNFNPAQNASANKRVPSTQKTQSPQKPLRQPASTTGTGHGNNGQSNLAKHNFKEDNNNRTQNNQSPLKGQQQQQPKVQTQAQLSQNKASPEKQRQRRGRGERSTSGDERGSNGINTYNPAASGKKGAANRGDSSDAGNGVVDLRFDEKGRPIKSTNQYNSSNAKPQKSNSKNPNNNNATDEVEYNTQNTANNNGDGENNKGGKNRRGRRDRDSSVGGSSMDGSDNYNTTNNNLKQQQKNAAGNNNNKHTLSPNEPRPLSKLPKPTERDDKPVRQSHNTMLPQIDEKLNTNGDGGEDGTFREYQNIPSSSRTGNDGGDTGRLIIFDKNTDFKTDNDYSINALNDNQTKKYLKSKASPLKKSMFKEDEDDVIKQDDAGDGDNNGMNDDDSNLSGNHLNTLGNNDNDSQQEGGQNSDGYTRQQQQNYQDPVGSIAMIQKKTPSRESRKVKSQMAMGGAGSGSNLYQQQQQQTPLIDNNNNNIQGLSSVINGSGSKTAGGGYKVDPTMGGDDLGMQSNHGGESIKFKEFLDSQNKGSPILGAGDRSGSRPNNLYNNSQHSPLKDEDDDIHQSNDRPMRREELDDTDLNDRAASSLAATLSRQQSNDKSANKQRRGRASRGGNQSSDQSMERQNPIEARNFDSIGSRNNNQVNQLGQSQSLNNNGQTSNKNSKSPNKSNSKSPSKSNRHNQQHQDGDEDNFNGDHQLTIEEHLDTYRSKTSSQMIIKSSRSFTSKNQQDDESDNYSDNNNDGGNYNNDIGDDLYDGSKSRGGRSNNNGSPMKSSKSRNNNNNDNEDGDGDNDQQYDGSKSRGGRSNINQGGSPMKSSKSRNNNNNDASNKHFTQSYDNEDFNNNNRSPNGGTQTHKSRRTNNNNDNSYQNSKNHDGNRTGTNKSNNSPSKKRYTNDNDDQDQDVYDQDRSQGNINSGRQESSRYQDDYNNHMNSNRKDNGDRRRENRRSQQNANNNYSNSYPNINNYSNNSDDNNNNYSQNNYNNNNDKSNINDNDRSSRNYNINNNGSNDNLMRQSQKSLTNLGNANYDEYNYSSFGQQQLNDNNDPYNDDQQNNSNNAFNTNQYNSNGKKQRRKRGSRERSNSNDQNNNNNDSQMQQQQQLRSSQIKNSMQPLRSSHANKYPTNYSNNGNDHQYKTNYSSNKIGQQQNNIYNNSDNEQQVKSKLEKYQSRLKELEDKLKQQVQANPTKPLDYRLIQEINDEAARTIQMRFRLKKLQRKQQEDAGKRHGNLVDRMVQTEPVNLYELTMKIHHKTTINNRSQANPQAQTATGSFTGSHDMDKFKRFFFAVFYTYMMMNTIMADVFKRQQPMQTYNQWNEEDYRNYINNRNNRNNNNNNQNNNGNNNK